MKKAVIFYVLLLPSALWAQQWRPLVTGDKFNFRVDTAGFISNVLFIDSTKYLNGDSVFYLNRVVAKCTGCPEPGYYLCNQPQFLGREMHRKPNGDYIFFSPGESLLKPLAALSESWIYDTAANITAQVTAIGAELVLGEPDSVKTVSLSNGRVIRLSKGHGITLFPVNGENLAYLLEGIDGRGLGVHLPGYKDIYNYNVGDVFQYRFEFMSYAMGDGGGGLLKQRILSKDSSSAGYTYEVESYRISWYESVIGFHGDSSHYYEVGTIEMVDSASNFCNFYPGQLIVDPLGPGTVGDHASLMVIRQDTGMAVSRYVGPAECPLFYRSSSDTLAPLYIVFYMNKYTTGLGNVVNDVSIFESSDQTILIGYVKNGDTTGVIYPDELILEKVPGYQQEQWLRIFPNPAKETVFLECQDGRAFSGHVELYTSVGRLVRSFDFSGSQAKAGIKISGLSAGLYFLVAKNDGKIQKVALLAE
jgi:hypothetical protein